MTDHGWLLVPGGLPKDGAARGTRGEHVGALRRAQTGADTTEDASLSVVLEPERRGLAPTAE